MLVAYISIYAGVMKAAHVALSCLRAVAEKEVLQKKVETEAKAGEPPAPSKENAEAVPASSGAPPPAPAATAAAQAPEGARGVEGGSPGAQRPQAGGTDSGEDQPAKPPDVDRKKVLYIQERSEHEKQVTQSFWQFCHGGRVRFQALRVQMLHWKTPQVLNVLKI